MSSGLVAMYSPQPAVLCPVLPTSALQIRCPLSQDTARGSSCLLTPSEEKVRCALGSQEVRWPSAVPAQRARELPPGL